MSEGDEVKNVWKVFDERLTMLKELGMGVNEETVL